MIYQQVPWQLINLSLKHKVQNKNNKKNTDKIDVEMLKLNKTMYKPHLAKKFIQLVCNPLFY